MENSCFYVGGARSWSDKKKEEMKKLGERLLNNGGNK